MASESDLDDLLALLPRRSAADEFALIQRARREGPPPEPTVIPIPDCPSFGTVRFSCPLGCGWYHDERPGAEPFNPPPVPLDPAAANRVLTAHANAQADAQRQRIEAAITDHYAQAHPHH